MKVAVLSANLGSFDTAPEDPVEQNGDSNIITTFHRFTDRDFPPITGLTGRMQYRIPKLFGWEMFPGYDFYIWLDASMSLKHPGSVRWLIDQIWNADMAFFKHPWRKTVKEEVQHIDDYLKLDKKYIVSRYKNGLHKEQLELMERNKEYEDNILYASMVFIYRQSLAAKDTLGFWWYYQSRYYTCDQVALPYAIHKGKARVNVIPGNPFKSEYVSLVSKHK